MSNGLSFPTILLSEEDDSLRTAWLRDLQHLGYFVLIAQNSADALEIVRVHSRPIHILLADESVEGRTLAATLKQYRPRMRVLFITRSTNKVGQDQLGFATTIDCVREILNPPVSSQADLREDRRPKMRAAGVSDEGME